MLEARRYVEVDEYSKTSADNIYAIGDITDRLALTPVALMEGGSMAKTLFGDEPTKPDHLYVPTAVFSQPHIGTVGYTEAGAVDAFGDVDVFTSSFKPMRNSISGNESRGFQKILVDAGSDRVVGMHMVGPEAGEIMQVRRSCCAAPEPVPCPCHSLATCTEYAAAGASSRNMFQTNEIPSTARRGHCHCEMCRTRRCDEQGLA